MQGQGHSAQRHLLSVFNPHDAGLAAHRADTIRVIEGIV